MSESVPNPGSDEALLQGCLCPVLDNNHGRHTPWPGEWWIREGCPLHDPPPVRIQIDVR